MSKTIIIAAIIAYCNQLYAQLPTSEEIRTKKIKQLITHSKDQFTDAINTTSIYYDSNGNDTALYAADKRTSYKKFDYDRKNRVLKTTEFSDEDKEIGKTIFSYNPDGSYTSTNIDAQFGMKVIDIYDTKGKQLSHFVPDGSVHKFVYNTKEQLIKMYSIPRKGGIKFTRLYTYNNKGQLIATKNTGNYTFSTTYQYNSVGLLKKQTTTSKDEANKKVISTVEYEYGF